MDTAAGIGKVTQSTSRQLLGSSALSMAGIQHNTSTTQSATVTLSGTFDVGDVYSITINGTAYTYTVLLANSTLSGTATALASLVNANADVSASATGAVITIAPEDPVATFTISSSATNRAAGTDNQTCVAATTSIQTTTATVGGTFEADDVFTVTLNGTLFSYTALIGDTNNSGVATALAAVINASASYDASATGAVITIVGAAAGYFTTASTAVNHGSTNDQTLVLATTSTQTTTITLGGTFNVGDVFSATLNGVAYTYTALLANTNLNGTATAFAAVIDLAAGYVASASGAVITVTNTPAGYFTTATSTTNIVVGTNDQYATIANTNGMVETTNTLKYSQDGKMLALAATTDIHLTGGTIVAPASAAVSRWYMVSIKDGVFTVTAGAETVNVDGTTYPLGLAVPAAPIGNVPCAAFLIVVAAGSTFIPNVTGLTAAGITTTYFDLAVVPTAGYPA